MTLQESQIAVAINGVADPLLLRAVQGTEEVGRLFKYDLDVLCAKHDLKHLDVLGQSATVSLWLPDGSTRYINGRVSGFTYKGKYEFRGAQGNQETFARYEVTIRPWLWFLSRRTDCRIYQEINVLDIITDVFSRHGFSGQWKKVTTKTYDSWEYCVQYHETDLDFVTRLMEQEGIYYFVEHSDGDHKVVLSDGTNQASLAGYDKIQHHIYDPAVERVFDWSITQNVESTKVYLDDFNFLTPSSNLSAPLAARASYVPANLPTTDLEVYEYPGKYPEKTDGEDWYAKMRVDELEARYESGVGSTNARGLTVGTPFEMTGHTDRTAENRTYLVLKATYDLHWTVDDAKGSPPPVFRCDFRAIDAARPYRLTRITPRPVVRGPQTAIVVGPAGETVWPDQHGRVKVQFHWDREGKSDVGSSCWVRVSQVWAGLGWGSMHIPHIGHEVIIEFLEGDPDRPIITGRVYNGANTPAYTLPDEKYRSVLRDEFGNEIVFNSKPGSEGIFMYSPNGNSSLQVGGAPAASAGTSTDWDNCSVVIGTKTDWVLGVQTATNVVSKSDFLLGFGTDIKVAGVVELKAGYSTSVQNDSTLSINFKDERRVSLDDVHEQAKDIFLIDSGNIIQLVGGAKQEARIKIDSKEIALEHLAPKPRVTFLTDAKMASIKTKLKIITGIATSASLIHAFQAPFTDKEDRADLGHRSGAWAIAIAAIHAIMSAFTAKLHYELNNGADVNVFQEATDTSVVETKVALDKSKVLIEAAKKNKIELTKTKLTIDTSKSNGNIMVKSGNGKITLTAVKMILLDTKNVRASHGLQTKNITDMG